MKYRWLFRLLLFGADLVLLEAAFFGVFWWRFESGLFSNPIRFGAMELIRPSMILSAYWISIFSWFGLYRFDPLQSRAVSARSAIKAVAIGILALFMLTFDVGQPLPRTRIILGSYGAALFLIASGNRVMLLTVLRSLRLRGIGVMRALLIGRSQQARIILHHIRTHPELGLNVCGAVSGAKEGGGDLDAIPLLGPLSQLRSVLEAHRFDAVVLAPEPDEERQLVRVLNVLRHLGLRAFISSEQYYLLVGEVKPTRVHGHPIVDIRPDVMSIVERILKRIIDIVSAVIVLVVTLPLWIVLCIVIPLESPGPIIYSQKRVGRNGRIFTLWKFRSMRNQAELQTGPVLAQEGDPRVTRIGRIIRAIRVDELPQLINVLIGQMSLVGPRPERIEFVEKFIKQIPLYERRLNVKPGLTGWSQVHLKYDSRADQIPLKLSYDFFYIENMSLPLDAKIMFMTLFVMLRGEGL